MNYYELKYLKSFIKSKIIGKEIVISNTRYKNLIEFFIEGGEQNHKLVFSTAPGNTALFLDYYSNPKKTNTVTFFEEIYNRKIKNIKIADTDRIFHILFEDGYELVFKLFSNNANVFLTKSGELIESFKGGDLDELDTPDAKEIELFSNLKTNASPKQKITGLNPLIPRNNLNELIELNSLDDLSDEEIISFTKKISEIAEHDSVFRLLENGNTAILNEAVLPIETERIFDSINDLIAYRYKTYSHNQRLRQQKSELKKSLKRQIKRTVSGLKNLDKADKSVDRAEKYEKFGHLLMANGHVKPVNPEVIEVDDLYDEGRSVKIPLNEKFSVIENAEKYYAKSKRSLESYEEAKSRIPILQKKEQELNSLLEEVGEINRLRTLNDWKKVNKKSLEEFNILDSDNSSDDQGPFHTLTVEEYPVWIGKNAKSNDKLVQMAHKEDVWLHARGVPGSHTLIRMGNDKEMPRKSVLLEVASYAAFNSKAKGSEIVPVIITKKKYVRKPKGAAAGAVLVDKEEVEFVTPKKPER